jgi:hypothetical protein
MEIERDGGGEIERDGMEGGGESASCRLPQEPPPPPLPQEPPISGSRRLGFDVEHNSTTDCD